ncbi:MAG: ATP-binding protein [Methanothrix sp.]|nr:ATP-binding protein [Methanothrix sp.]
MSQSRSRSGEISLGPCPPDEFSGRADERKTLLEVLQEAKDHGQVVMISGRRGSGKSSFLSWAEDEIQNETKGSNCPAIRKEFLETAGMVFFTYRELLTNLKEHQKFGWFRKSLDDPKVKKSIEVGLGIIEKMSSLAGPASIGVEAGVAAARGFLPTENVDYTQLLSSFLQMFRALSEKMVEEDKFMAILLDDVQWSSGPDFQLIKDLIKSLPTRIVLIIAFRVEAENEKKHAELQGEISRFGHKEIRLGGMTEEAVKEFASRRYGLSIDDQTADFLSQKIGDPLCLVGCFNLLQKRNLSPSIGNFKAILPQALDSARCIYTGLDSKWQSRVNSLCILHPPLRLSVISCMLKEEDLVVLKDELDQSLIFRRLETELYDFAHPSLREYRRKELPEGAAVKLHSQAAKCLENLEARL